jgi:hypothetical protein
MVSISGKFNTLSKAAIFGCDGGIYCALYCAAQVLNFGDERRPAQGLRPLIVRYWTGG